MKPPAGSPCIPAGFPDFLPTPQKSPRQENDSTPPHAKQKITTPKKKKTSNKKQERPPPPPTEKKKKKKKKKKTRAEGHEVQHQAHLPLGQARAEGGEVLLATEKEDHPGESPFSDPRKVTFNPSMLDFPRLDPPRDPLSWSKLIPGSHYLG